MRLRSRDRKRNKRSVGPYVRSPFDDMCVFFLTRSHEIITRAHEIITRAHQIISHAHEILSRAHEIISRCGGGGEGWGMRRGTPPNSICCKMVIFWCLGGDRNVDDVGRKNKLPGARELGVRGVRPHPHVFKRGCGAPPLLEVEIVQKGVKSVTPLAREKEFYS